jgi:hypothetical protein
LPLNLIQHIFLHLPFPHIIHLGVPSKEWDKHVIGKTPGFTNLCAEFISPKLFGMLI